MFRGRGSLSKFGHSSGNRRARSRLSSGAAGSSYGSFSSTAPAGTSCGGSHAGAEISGVTLVTPASAASLISASSDSCKLDVVTPQLGAEPGLGRPLGDHGRAGRSSALDWAGAADSGAVIAGGKS